MVGTHYGREWLLNLSTGLAAPPSATSGDPIIFRLLAHFKHNVCAIKGNESSSRYLHSTIYIHTDRCRHLYAQCLHSSALAADIYPALGVDIYKHTSSSSDPVPGAPPHPATRCRYLHTRYLHSVDIPSDPTLLLFPGMCPGCRVSELSPDLGYREPGARCQQQPHSHTGR